LEKWRLKKKVITPVSPPETFESCGPVTAETLRGFIKLYNLDDMNKVRWAVNKEKKTLTVCKMTGTRKLLCEVIYNGFDLLPTGEYGIETKEMKKALRQLSGPITMTEAVTAADEGHLFINDKNDRVNIVLLNLDLIQGAPKLKMTPVYDYTLDFNEDQKRAFVKAFNDLDIPNKATHATEIRQNGLWLAYQEKYGVNKKTKQVIGSPKPVKTLKGGGWTTLIYYPHLKDIFEANPEGNTTIHISEQGLGFIQYAKGPYNVLYYIIKRSLIN
jgi:hypothetical protein